MNGLSLLKHFMFFIFFRVIKLDKGVILFKKNKVLDLPFQVTEKFCAKVFPVFHI